MGILILSGPPGAGKNTIAAAYARARERCAVIDVDLVRWMVLRPHKAPWEGQEGQRQRQLGVHNACLLARSFAKRGYPVLIHDILAAETARHYRRELRRHAPVIVLLFPTLTEIERRNALRPARLTKEEIIALYRAQERFTEYDHSIDNSTLSAEEVATQLLAL